MRLGGGNPNRHWHHWSPLNNDVKTVKHCECGAIRKWNGKKWVVRKPKTPMATATKEAPANKPYPPTPELDKMHAVKDKSQVLGEFLDIFLNEKGITLCTMVKAGDNGEPKYRWKKGVKKAKLDGLKTKDREPSFKDVFNKDAEHNPDYVVWSEGYAPIHTSVEKLLAEFFEIDLNKIENERRAILAHIRGE